MNFKLVWEPHGVVLRFSGQITIADIVNASVAYAADSRFDDLLYVIADYSEISACTTHPEQIEEVWIRDKGASKTNNRIKKAIVTTSPEVVALANRYRNTPDAPFPVKIFATEAEARVWLHNSQEVIVAAAK